MRSEKRKMRQHTRAEVTLISRFLQLARYGEEKSEKSGKEKKAKEKERKGREKDDNSP